MKKTLLLIISLAATALGAMAQTFTPTPVTPPADLMTEVMMANVTSETWSYTFEQEVRVGYAGNDVYILGLLPDFTEAWLHGTLSGNTITFPMGQFLDYFGEEGFSYESYACGYNNSGYGEELCDFVLERDETTGVLYSPSGIGLGEYMEYAGSYYSLDKLTTIIVNPISNEVEEPVFVPADAERHTYYLDAEDLRDGPLEYEAILAFKDNSETPGGQDVYLADFCKEARISCTAIKGYWSDEETLVFPSEQFLELYEDDMTGETANFYFYGAAYDEETGKVTTGDLILDYNAETDTFHSRFTGILISLGKITTSEITFSEFLQNIVLFPAEEEEGIAATTLPAAAATIYSLDGRQQKGHGKGITISAHRKSINR